MLDNTAHEFVILSVFVAQLTNDLSLINHIYSILHACQKRVKRANHKVCFNFNFNLFHPFDNNVYWINPFIILSFSNSI